MSSDRDCVLECGPDKTCYADTCCARSSNQNQPPGAVVSDTSQQDPGPSLHQRAKCSTPEQTRHPSDCHVVHDPETFTDNLVAPPPCWSSPVIETSDTRAWLPHFLVVVFSCFTSK